MIKKKLLVFHPGLATYRVDFFNALSDSYNARFYFTFKFDQTHQFSQESLKKKIRFQPNYLTGGFSYKNKTIRSGIIKAITSNKPDIIICSEYSPITVIIALYKYVFQKQFKLYTLCDDSLTMAKNGDGLRAVIKILLDKLLDGIIFPSNAVGSYYKASTKSGIKILEMPIIHSDSSFRKELENSLPLTKELFKKHKLDEKIIILFVGRLAPEKNLKTLISAFSKINESKLKLVMIGDGSLKEELMHMTEKFQLNNQIYFLGKKEGEELLAWYNLAHIFVLPSLHEPFGAVVNEALLAGNFILCSRLAGAASLINRSNGELFDPKTEGELAEKLNLKLKKIILGTIDLNRLRQNKMPFTFEDKFDILIQDLNSNL